ncbi:hypothetical protein [Mesorhizobium sp. KR9-304]|uniref:hypothetical protein n=1 Tax=Mesorhizobium sp. KR9-304 TaxID=3156614 RepID=UPI0032B54411
MLNLRSQLISVSNAYCAATRLSRSRVSTIVLNRGATLDKIAAGESDINTGTFEKALLWYSANWPENAVWPDDVARPRSTEAAA